MISKINKKAEDDAGHFDITDAEELTTPDPDIKYTIVLGSGTYFDYINPENTPLTIEDVAYSLAYNCRFAGHTYSKATKRRVFYSVAQHCILMSKVVSPNLALAALMHELGEVTCGDVTSPLKVLLPQYKTIEKRCEAAGLKQFGVDMKPIKSKIKEADMKMLATEKRDLTNTPDGDIWHYVGGMEPYDFTIVPYSHPDVAALEFINRYNQLTGNF